MRYQLDDGSRIFCRTCQEETPHNQTGPSHMGCQVCNRKMHVVEIVASYSADEYSKPAEILLPLRNRPYIRTPVEW